MFANYLLIAWRNIIKKPLFSAINIIGLAIGLMSCILIMLFVRAESGYDSWITDNDRVVRLHTAYTMRDSDLLTVRSAGRMMPALRDYMSNEIESGVRLVSWGTTIRKDGQGFDDHVIFGDEQFFDVLDLPLVHGDSASSFAKPNDLLVTEETAIRYFGRTDVVGETLTLCCLGGQPIELAIAGVLKDLPDNTHLNINMLIYMDVALFSTFPGLLETWNSVNVYTYFKLREGVSVAQAQERMRYWVNNESPFVEQVKNFRGDLPEGTQVTDVIQHKFMPLPDLYLNAHKDAGTMGDFKALGNGSMVVTFTLVALLILLIACINFMNLSTARAGQRAREVAMRKVVGASRNQVTVQFLIEAIGLVFISMLIALVAVELAQPFYNEILNRNIEFNLIQDPQLLLALLVVVVVVGIGAGSYPALVLSRYMPGKILKASKSNDSSGSTTLRSALVVLQFAVSIGLLVSTAVVYLQTKHANEMDLGYTSEQKLVLGVGTAGDNLDSLKQQLEAIPAVQSVVYSSEAPSQDNENNRNYTRPGVDGNEPVTELLNYHNMDYGFFEAYGVQPLAGRLFDEAFGADVYVPATEETAGSGGVILNESAVRRLGFESPQQAVGTELRNETGNGVVNHTIVGVIPDLFFRSVKFDVRPTIYMLDKSRMRVATVSFTGSPREAREAVEGVWNTVVPLEPVHLQFLDEMIERQYRQEIAQMRLFSAFSVLAIIVACLGLYGLAAFSAERRTKEIGVRKVMGASVKDIVLLLVWQFSRPVLIANIIAWPIATWLMLTWLQQFPYRIELFMLFPICVGAALVSVTVAWVTVGGNAAKVASANPIGALRHE